MWRQDTAEPQGGTKHNRLFLSFNSIQSRGTTPDCQVTEQLLQQEQELNGSQGWHSAQELLAGVWPEPRHGVERQNGTPLREAAKR